jgi:hypothetical protein
MGTYLIGFKPAVDPTNSIAPTSRTQSALQIDLSAYGNTIDSRHLVAANQKITGAFMYARAATNLVASSISMAVYVANSGTNAAGARVGASWNMNTSSSTPAWLYTPLDIDLSGVVGQYIKPAGGYSTDARPYYVTVTSGHNVYTASNTPNPFGAATNGVNMIAMYLVIEDIAPEIVSIDGDPDPLLFDESQNLTVVTANIGTITSGTLEGRTVTINSASANTCNIDLPMREDGMVWPSMFGSNVTLELTDGVSVASREFQLFGKQGESASILIDPSIVNPTTFGGQLFALGYTVASNDEVIYNYFEGGLAINITGEWTTDELRVLDLWWRRAATGVWNSFNISFVANTSPGGRNFYRDYSLYPDRSPWVDIDFEIYGGMEPVLVDGVLTDVGSSPGFYQFSAGGVIGNAAEIEVSFAAAVAGVADIYGAGFVGITGNGYTYAIESGIATLKKVSGYVLSDIGNTVDLSGVTPADIVGFRIAISGGAVTLGLYVNDVLVGDEYTDSVSPYVSGLLFTLTTENVDGDQGFSSLAGLYQAPVVDSDSWAPIKFIEPIKFFG